MKKLRLGPTSLSTLGKPAVLTRGPVLAPKTRAEKNKLVYAWVLYSSFDITSPENGGDKDHVNSDIDLVVVVRAICNELLL